MIRYKNTLRVGDLLWNILFFTTFLTYTIEVETCETGLVAIARHELDYLKESAKNETGRKSENSADTLTKSANVSERIQGSDNFNSEMPFVKNYKTMIQKQFFETEQPYVILFASGVSILAESEKKKLDSYAKVFLTHFGSGSQKILLIGTLTGQEVEIKSLNFLQTVQLLFQSI